MQVDEETLNQFKNNVWFNYNDLAVDFFERAAIMEFDGCLSRKEAEQQAYFIVLKQHGYIQ